MDWLDLLAVQGTLKSLLQHHSSKAFSLKTSQKVNMMTSHNPSDENFIFGAPRSLQMVIAAMKLKDAYSLEDKL